MSETATCPKCHGVPVSDAPGCEGCLECDFTGTLEGYDAMQQMMHEAFELELKFGEGDVPESSDVTRHDPAKAFHQILFILTAPRSGPNVRFTEKQAVRLARIILDRAQLPPQSKNQS